MLAISQNKSGLRKLHQHLSLKNIHQRRLLIEEIFCKLQLVMCHIFLTEMLIMIKLENKVKKREDQLKLVTTHFTNLQLIMKRELLLHKLDQTKWLLQVRLEHNPMYQPRKNQATKKMRMMNQVLMSQSHSLLLQRMIHCSKSLNNFSMMPRILRKILLKYQSQPNSSNLLSKLLPNPSKLLSHPRLLQPQLSQLNLLLQFKLQLQLKHQQLRLLLLPKRLMVPQLPNR